jgi:hypothetical protein
MLPHFGHCAITPRRSDRQLGGLTSHSAPQKKDPSGRAGVEDLGYVSGFY